MNRVGGYIANTNGLPSAACWSSSFQGYLDAYTLDPTCNLLKFTNARLQKVIFPVFYVHTRVSQIHCL